MRFLHQQKRRRMIEFQEFLFQEMVTIITAGSFPFSLPPPPPPSMSANQSVSGCWSGLQIPKSPSVNNPHHLSTKNKAVSEAKENPLVFCPFLMIIFELSSPPPPQCPHHPLLLLILILITTTFGAADQWTESWPNTFASTFSPRCQRQVVFFLPFTVTFI